MLKRQQKTFTPAEYLTLEDMADYKSEYYRGEIFAMAGGSSNHSRLAVAITSTLEAALADGPYEVFNSDLKLAIQAREFYTYPDVMVICGEVQFLEGRTDTVLNPTVIVEVLSPSTAKYDRGLKFEQYQAIESLTDYVLINQERVAVEHFHRIDGGQWVLTPLTAPEAVLRLETLDFAVPLNRLYNKVDWFEA